MSIFLSGSSVIVLTRPCRPLLDSGNVYRETQHEGGEADDQVDVAVAGHARVQARSVISSHGTSTGRGLRKVLRIEPVRFAPDPLVDLEIAPPPRLRTASPPLVAGPSRQRSNAPAPSRSPSPLTPLSSPSPTPPPARLIRTFSTKTEVNIFSLTRFIYSSSTSSLS